jgi:hypothetical protein
MRVWWMISVTALVATAAGAQASGQMRVGTQAPQVQGRSGGLDQLSPAQRLELLQIAEAERNRARRGPVTGCGAEEGRKAMSDLERANWRLKCRR